MKLRAILIRSVILLLFMAGAGFVAVKARGPRQAPAVPAGPPVSNDVAKPASNPNGLTFESEVVEARVAADASHGQIDFSFENRTGRTINVSRVEKNCDCVEMMISGGKLSYAPGERGIIRAKYQIGNMVGTVDKPFTLWLEGDSEKNPSHTLVSRLIIPELVKLSAKTVRWRLGGDVRAEKVDIEVTSEQPIRLQPPTCTTDSVKAEMKTIEEGRRYELWITPVDTSVGSLTLVRMETDCPLAKWRVVQVFASVENKPASPP